MDRIRILLADDHALFRDGFIRILRDEKDMECVAIAEDGEEAIRLVKAGERVYDTEATGWIISGLTKHDERRLAVTGDIYERELQVLKLAARGWGNKEIARELSISENTVGNHLASISKKLGVRSRTEAVLYGLKQGWFSIEDLA